MTASSRLSRINAGDGSELNARQPFLSETDKTGVRTQKVRLAVRAQIGRDWDGKADNDNIAWPLAKALLAEGNDELLKYAIKYRKIYDQAKSEVMIGFKGAASPDMVVVRKSTVNESTGHISYGGDLVIKSAPTEMPATMKSPTNPDSKKNAAPVPKPWTGDMEIINAMDARELLAHLQAKVGSTIEPFEMAVIDGATLAEAGNAAGIANRGGAMAAGRAILHMGLLAVRDALGPVNYRELAA